MGKYRKTYNDSLKNASKTFQSFCGTYFLHNFLDCKIKNCYM